MPRPTSILEANIGDRPYEILAQLKPYIGEELKIVMTRNGKYVGAFTASPRTTFDDFSSQFFEDYGNNDSFLPLLNNATEIHIFRAEEVKKRRFQQIYRESENKNCVFVPMIRAVSDILETDISANTRKKYQKMLNAIMIETQQYENGVPHDEIIPLAERLGLRIELTDVLGQTQLESGSKNSKINVKISNTRANHVDQYTDDAIYEISQQEMNDKYKELKKSGEFYIIYNNTDTIKTLKTLQGTFKTINPDKSFIDAVNQQIRCSSIDALKYPELNNFLKAGRIIHSTAIQYKPFTEHIKCWDMKNAYAQYKQCKYYEGFPRLLHQYRNTDKIQKLGLYEFIVEQSTPHSRLKGLFNDTKHILPSPEIKFWIQNGVELEIIRGAWGSSFDLEMPDEFVKKKLYNVWAGKLSASDNFRFTKHTFPATQEFAEFVKSEYTTTKYWRHAKEAQVTIPNKHVNTNHHIFGFLTSYVRITMLEEMLKIPIEDLYGVQLDAIYTTRNISNPLFREKPIKTFEPTGKYWYSDVAESFDFQENGITENSLLSGQGGTGKTYSIMKDKGYLNVVYVVPEHSIGKNEESHVTIHKLVGAGCEPLYTSYIPNVILIDEITMIHADMVKQALELYPHSLILLAGDIDNRQHYQCRGGYTNNYMPIYKNTLPIVEFTIDRRSNTETLKTMKLEIRNEMKKIFTDGGIEDTRKMRKFMEKYSFITLEEARSQYKEGDTFMCSTHKVMDQLQNYNPRGVHEFQGKTIETGKVFITSDWFEYAMPYTAVSRVRSHEQIIFCKV